MTAAITDRYFDPKRFLHLIRWELYMNYRSLIVILATTLGIVFTVNVFSVAAAPHFRIHDIFYPTVVLMAGGLVFSSLAFRDAHEPGGDLRYLTLPCSRLEKTLAKFAVTAAGYVVLSAAAFFAMTALASLVTLIVAGRSHGLSNPFAPTALKLIGIYLIVQSVFVFGSLYFRRMAFAKTLLALLALAFAVSLFSGLVFGLLHLDLILRGAWGDLRFAGGGFDSAAFWRGWGIIPDVVFYGLVAPFFWVLTYVRLKELEVRSV